MNNIMWVNAAHFVRVLHFPGWECWNCFDIHTKVINYDSYESHLVCSTCEQVIEVRGKN